MEKEMYSPDELMGIQRAYNLDNLLEQTADQVEGLGFAKFFNRKGFFHHFKPVIYRQITRSVISRVKNSIAPKTVKALSVHSNKFSVDTKRAIANGSVKSADSTFYIRREITGQSGIFEMFNDSIDKVVGTTNISKAKLPEMVNLIMNRLAMREGEGNTVTDAEYNAMIYGATDAALLNGELEMSIGGKTVFELPVNDFMQPAKGGHGPADGKDFDVPVFVPEQTNIQIRIKFAGKMDDTNKHFIEVSLKGAATKPVK